MVRQDIFDVMIQACEPRTPACMSIWVQATPYAQWSRPQWSRMQGRLRLLTFHWGLSGYRVNSLTIRSSVTQHFENSDREEGGVLTEGTFDCMSLHCSNSTAVPKILQFKAHRRVARDRLYSTQRYLGSLLGSLDGCIDLGYTRSSILSLPLMGQHHSIIHWREIDKEKEKKRGHSLYGQCGILAF